MFLWLIPVLFVAPVGAADLQGQQAPAGQKAIVPIKVDLGIARFQGDKKISSLPFSMFVNANELRDPGAPRSGLQTTSLRMSVLVPLPVIKSGQTETSYSPVGTNIDCSAEETDDGRFRLQMTINDSALVSPQTDGKPAAPGGTLAVRTFNTTNRIMVRPGQPVQFTAATDVITGEVVRIEVMVTVLK
jgi:hypothetical protein